MKICLITIDHGKPDFTSRLYSSLSNQSLHDVVIHFFILENSGKVSNESYEFIKSINHGVARSEVRFVKNDGYFGTASAFLSEVDCELYDWVIVCNNDLVFECNFFYQFNDRLVELRDRYLICPSVIEQGRNINPLSKSKYHWLKKKYWDFYYSCKLFARWYEPFRIPISKIKSHLRTFAYQAPAEGEVYLAYGAIYIINPKFIERLGGLPAKTFLYQEESVICGLARSYDNWPYFLPSLCVYHESHATLRFIKFDIDYQLRRDSWWATRTFL